ncbi:MAG: hypothetical protein U9R74_00695 [Pseudomonadota bacterium]|nr:hypothetical protein [Pseudomonadota bacterium]
MATPTTTIRLPAELRKRLERYARHHDETNTEVVVQALDNFLSRQDSSDRRDEISRELERLSRIDRDDPEYQEFYGPPEKDPFTQDQ